MISKARLCFKSMLVNLLQMYIGKGTGYQM